MNLCDLSFCRTSQMRKWITVGSFKWLSLKRKGGWPVTMARTIVRSRAIKEEIQGPRLAVLRAADFCVRALDSSNLRFEAVRWVCLKQRSMGQSDTRRNSFCSFLMDDRLWMFSNLPSSREHDIALQCWYHQHWNCFEIDAKIQMKPKAFNV